MDELYESIRRLIKETTEDSDMQDLAANIQSFLEHGPDEVASGTIGQYIDSAFAYFVDNKDRYPHISKSEFAQILFNSLFYE